MPIVSASPSGIYSGSGLSDSTEAAIIIPDSAVNNPVTPLGSDLALIGDYADTSINGTNAYTEQSPFTAYNNAADGIASGVATSTKTSSKSYLIWGVGISLAAVIGYLVLTGKVGM